jgi:ParB family chromosome partitioning protein
MEKKEQKMQLPKITLDDFFTTQEQRDNAKLEKVIDIKIDNIDDFPNHPFKVIDNEDMEQMKDSIIDNGVLVPALVRPKADGRYEMVSGHRRKFASQLANKETIPCIVRELSDDEALIIMVDSNRQRNTTK